MKTISLLSVKEVLLAIETLDSTLPEIESGMFKLREIEVLNPRVRDTLAGLFEHAVSSYLHLKRAWTMEDVSYLAWASRNLLELRVWSRFVTTSQEQAEEFYQEWILDGLGKAKALKEYAISVNENEATIRKLDPFIEKLTELKCQLTLQHDKNFYNLNVVASRVGIEKEFKSAYKFLGNLVHPTPWLITRLQDVVEGDSKRQEIFIASVGINS